MALDFLTSLFQGNAGSEGPQKPGLFSGIGDALSGIKTSIEENPDRFAIIADTIGSSIAPDNPLAGVGTSIGQSNIAAKAATEQRGERQDLFKALLSRLKDPDDPLSGFKSNNKGGLSFDLNPLESGIEKVRQGGS